MCFQQQATAMQSKTWQQQHNQRPGSTSLFSVGPAVAVRATHQSRVWADLPSDSEIYDIIIIIINFLCLCYSDGKCPGKDSGRVRPSLQVVIIGVEIKQGYGERGNISRTAAVVSVQPGQGLNPNPLTNLTLNLEPSFDPKYGIAVKEPNHFFLSDAKLRRVRSTSSH